MKALGGKSFPSLRHTHARLRVGLRWRPGSRLGFSIALSPVSPALPCQPTQSLVSVGHGVEVLEKFVPRHPYRAWVGTWEITPAYRHQRHHPKSIDSFSGAAQPGSRDQYLDRVAPKSAALTGGDMALGPLNASHRVTPTGPPGAFRKQLLALRAECRGSLRAGRILRERVQANSRRASRSRLWCQTAFE